MFAVTPQKLTVNIAILLFSVVSRALRITATLQIHYIIQQREIQILVILMILVVWIIVFV